ncbi:MAG: hypothetical protein DYG90_00420 [Chloroflexi bacterium CFX6]|nr:hypothetical protein [Chloroflexi bacterium CFX6]
MNGEDPSPRRSSIVGQAVIVVTEGPQGIFHLRSFASPDGSADAGEFADRLAHLAHAIVQVHEMPEGHAVVDVAGVTRLRSIETAARAVLTYGQARYEGEELWIGDLVPAAVLQALRTAVHGDPAAVVAGDEERDQ